MLKAASRGRAGIAGQSGQILIDLFGVDLFGQFPEMDYKKGDAPDVII